MFDLRYLDLYDKVTIQEMMEKFKEEIEEVKCEVIIPITNKHDLAHELLDVMQVCMGIAYTHDIDLESYVEAHNKKMLSRGYKLK